MKLIPVFSLSRYKVPTSISSLAICTAFLSNSRPKFKVQTSVLGLGVDFVFPLSQQQQEQEQEQEQQQEQQQPPPKSIRRGCTKSLKFDI